MTGVVLLCFGIYVVIPVYLSQIYLHPPRVLPGNVLRRTCSVDFEPVEFMAEDGSNWPVVTSLLEVGPRSLRCTDTRQPQLPCRP